MRWFTARSKVRPAREAVPGFDAPIRPDSPFCAVGDIHGRMDLLSDVLGRLALDGPDLPVVFVGDYIDRGPDSAAVLRHLCALQSTDPERISCLLGNHEDMLLAFLDGSLHDHRIWLRNGGVATLQSFGISLSAKSPAPDEVAQIRSGLQDAMGSELLTWLRGLPLVWNTGNVWVTHAGADPFVDMPRQDRTALLWGHPDFRRHARTDGQWVVHGHTIVPEVECRDGRVAIDTGAFHTGRLSAVQLSNEGVRPLG